VGGTYYVLTLTTSLVVMLCGFAAGSLATVLLVINNLRDRPTDASSRKRTMAVRFGERFARAEVTVFVLLPFAATVVIAGLTHDWSFLVPLGALVLAIPLLRRVSRSTGVELNKSLALAGALQWAFGVLFAVAALLR
jgi:1,4-dihydroxy-2-naphthoate octaprenyltransferase